MHLPQLVAATLDRLYQPLLIALVTPLQVQYAVNNVSLRHVDDLDVRESDRISQLFAPAFFVEVRRVKRILAGVHMCPAILLLNIDLGPHVIRPVKNQPRIVTERLAYSSEGIGPLTAATGARLKQLARMVVSRESHFDAVLFADPGLDAAGVILSVLSRRIDVALIFHILLVTTLLAFWCVEPGEEVVLEPGQKSLQLFDLLARWPLLRRHLEIAHLCDVLGHD